MSIRKLCSSFKSLKVIGEKKIPIKKHRCKSLLPPGIESYRWLPAETQREIEAKLNEHLPEIERAAGYNPETKSSLLDSIFRHLVNMAKKGENVADVEFNQKFLRTARRWAEINGSKKPKNSINVTQSIEEYGTQIIPPELREQGVTEGRGKIADLIPARGGAPIDELIRCEESEITRSPMKTFMAFCKWVRGKFPKKASIIDILEREPGSRKHFNKRGKNLGIKGDTLRIRFKRFLCLPFGKKKIVFGDVIHGILTGNRNYSYDTFMRQNEGEIRRIMEGISNEEYLAFTERYASKVN